MLVANRTTLMVLTLPIINWSGSVFLLAAGQGRAELVFLELIAHQRAPRDILSGEDVASGPRTGTQVAPSGEAI
jgi:hypothetical protein